MRNKYDAGEASISIKRDIDRIRLIITLPDKGDIELTLTLTDARKLGRLLMTYSETNAVQMDLLLRKLSDMEKTISSIEERVRSLEAKARSQQ